MSAHSGSSRNLQEVEQSPDGRYVRFDEKLGTGAYKDVFLAYDTETGKEVAWNSVNLSRLPPAEKKRIRMETEILKELEHPHIINFFSVWDNPVRDQICFTTEIVTSGTLKQYVSRVRNLKLKVIKKWCRQILGALDYLHSHQPPIIHRDLKCDNIFINGASSEVRLGDFGLSAARHTTHVESVLGTPEFMAPELYDENYTEKVDCWSFGLCVLEMVTKEYPYQECTNAAQIWKKVSGGQKPEVLQRILNHEVRAFIEICLMPADQRLSARELLKHPFLKYKRSDPAHDNMTVAVAPRSSPAPQREGKQEQQEKFRAAAEQQRHDQEARVAQLNQQLKQQEQIQSQIGGRHPINNYSLESPDGLISPGARPSPSPTPPHPLPAVSHHPPHINTATPTPTHVGAASLASSQHGPGTGATAASPHPRSTSGAGSADYAHASHEQLPQPNSAQTPPSRVSRNTLALPMGPSGGGVGGLTHSQSTNVFSALQHPHPQRMQTPQGAPPHPAGPNPSPDLVHVASVSVEIESTHSHYANVALHIHFEGSQKRRKADGTYCLGRDVRVLLADGRDCRVDQLTYHSRLIDDEGNILNIAVPPGVQARLPDGRSAPLPLSGPVPMVRVSPADRQHAFSSFTCTRAHQLTVAPRGKDLLQPSSSAHVVDLRARDLFELQSCAPHEFAQLRLLKCCAPIMFESPNGSQLTHALRALFPRLPISEEVIQLSAWLCGAVLSANISLLSAHASTTNRVQRWLSLLETANGSSLDSLLKYMGLACPTSLTQDEGVRLGWIRESPPTRCAFVAGLLDGAAVQQRQCPGSVMLDSSVAAMVATLGRISGFATHLSDASRTAVAVLDPSHALSSMCCVAQPAVQSDTSSAFETPFTLLVETVSIEHVQLEVCGGNGRGRFLLADGTITHNSSRKSKQIRFEYDFYRDTSQSIANEMVRALKLPDQERTARLIASHMEAKIDPLRKEYYRNNGAATTTNARHSHTSQEQTIQQAVGRTGSQQAAHQHAGGTGSEPASPSTSPNLRGKPLSRPVAPQSAHGPGHDGHGHERHPPPYPPPTPQQGAQGRSSAPPVSPTPPPPHGSPQAGGVTGHYGTMPVPSPQQAPASGKAHSSHQHPQSYNTIPGPHAHQHALGAGHTPKLSSVQPTNVGGPRPSAGAPPSAKPSPHPSAYGGGAAATVGTSGPVKGVGPRRHSAEPEMHFQQQSHPTPPQHSPDPLAMPSMGRTSSLGMMQHSASQHFAVPGGGAGTGAHTGGLPGTSAAGGAGMGGMRRSSSTSSLAFMLTPEEMEAKTRHDRLYDEYRLLSIANLKDRIKERMRDRLKEDGPAVPKAEEQLNLTGVLEKSDLIESLIRLTPKTKGGVLPGDADRNAAGYPLSAASASHPQHRGQSPARSSSPHNIHTGAGRQFDEHSHTSDSSAQSTPRMLSYDSRESGGVTPADPRSRLNSIDHGEHGLLASLAPIALSRTGSNTSRQEEHGHGGGGRDVSPNLSPSTSPVPSPSAKRRQERRMDEAAAGAPPGAGTDHEAHAPSSHRMVTERRAVERGGGGAAGGTGTELSPSPLIRATSSPNEVQTDSAHPKPSSYKASQVGLGGHPAPGHGHGGLETAPAASARNFTFREQPGSGGTSPASTNSTLSYASSTGGHLDLDELSRDAHHHHAVTFVPPQLHVDINPNTPNSSAPASAEILTSPAPQRVAAFPTVTSQTNAAGSAAASATAQYTPHMPHLTPQSPTIPEESGVGDELDESSAAGITPTSHDAPFEAAFGLDQGLRPGVPRVSSLPTGLGGSASGGRSQSMSQPGSSPHAFRQPMGQPSSNLAPSALETGVNPPLARRKDQYSASVDDISRLVIPAHQQPVVSAGLQPNPSSSPPSGGTTSSAAHLRHGSVPESDRGPPSSTRSASAATGPSHARANSVFVGGSSGSQALDQEAQRKIEAARQKRKLDASKQAKECESKILNFSLH